jgi:DNA-binding NarL/FixJ family response regulator
MDLKNDKKVIRVLVADRSAKTGHVVAQIFETASGFKCVGVATDPAYFTDSPVTRSADVLLLDPGSDGTDWIAPLDRLQSTGVVRGVVIFSLYGRLMEKPILKRADAFLRKDCGFEELLTTVRSVAERKQAEGKQQAGRT